MSLQETNNLEKETSDSKDNVTSELLKQLLTVVNVLAKKVESIEIQLRDVTENKEQNQPCGLKMTRSSDFKIKTELVPEEETCRDDESDDQSNEQEVPTGFYNKFKETGNKKFLDLKLIEQVTNFNRDGGPDMRTKKNRELFLNKDENLDGTSDLRKKENKEKMNNKYRAAMQRFMLEAKNNDN